jgi:UrcA family protein
VTQVTSSAGGPSYEVSVADARRFHQGATAMQRLIIAAATAAILAVAASAHAAGAADQTVRVSVTAAQLQSPAGLADVKRRITLAAQTYCRANPAGRTVFACERDVAQTLQGQVEQQRVALNAAPMTMAQAGR